MKQSIEQQYRDAAEEYDAEQAKLTEMEQDFDRQVTQKIPLALFQSLESAIRQQSLYVDALKKTRDELEQEYAGEQRQLATDCQRKELLQHKENVIAQLSQIDLDIPRIRQQLIDLGVELAVKEGQRNSLLTEHSRVQDEINAIR